MNSFLYTDKTKRALQLCFDAHANLRDKAGLPYVFHPFYLATQMHTEDEICTALLHDVIEDSSLTLDDIRREGFSEDVIEALALLSHNDDEDYLSYVERLSHNKLARTVKLADLRHNSDPHRLDRLSDTDLSRLEKYEKAQALLRNAEPTYSVSSLLEDLNGALNKEASWINVRRIARLASKHFGKRFVAGDAASYVYHYARSEGYDIPAYPLSSSGEIKKFFADEGVSDIPSWYESKGITHDGLASLYGKTLVEIRRMNGSRKTFIFASVLYKEPVVFRPLEESGFIDASHPDVLGSLLHDALTWVSEEEYQKTV